MTEFLPLSKILMQENIREPGWEKRVDSLKANISASGLQEPIGVKPLDSPGPDGETHLLIFGHRRLQACRDLNLRTVAVIFLPKDLTKKEALLRQVAENTGREELSAIEKACIFRRLIDEYDMSVKDIAEKWGNTESSVSQHLALLKMPEPIVQAVREERITPTHARELARVTDEKTQARLLNAAENLSVPELKEKVQSLPVEQRRHNSRGRPTKEEQKQKKGKKKEGEEKEGNGKRGSAPTVRTLTEGKRAMAMLDSRLKSARANNDKLASKQLTGMLRGIGWMCGLADRLFDEEKGDKEQK